MIIIRQPSLYGIQELYDMAATQKYEAIISTISRMTKLIVSISVNPFDNYFHATHEKVPYVLQDKPPLFPRMNRGFCFARKNH